MKKNNKLSNINTHHSVKKEQIVNNIHVDMEKHGYNIIEVNHSKPWGAYFRLHDDDIDKFIEDFFPNLELNEIRLNNGAGLSPKILLVSPRQRLSWQYHNRRAELWYFVNDGAYCSGHDEEDTINYINGGNIIKLSCNEKHRLIGSCDNYTLVAEIWQHIDYNEPSDEDDIIRISDDYKR